MGLIFETAAKTPRQQVSSGGFKMYKYRRLRIILRHRDERDMTLGPIENSMLQRKTKGPCRPIQPIRVR